MNTFLEAHQQTRLIGLLFLFSAVLLANCSVIEPAVPKKAPTSTVTQIVSPSSTPRIVTSSPPQTATIARTLSPSQTPTAEPIPSPTEVSPTRSPTLAPNERKAFIMDLFLNNGGCALPCFWGFTPGETKWDEARQVLEKLNDNIFEVNYGKGRYRYDVDLQNYSDNLNLGASFYTEGGIIETINSEQWIDQGSVQWELTQQKLSLKSFMSKYGQPERIQLVIWIGDEELPDQAHYSLFFFYDQAGFAFWQTMDATRVSEAYQACPNEEHKDTNLNPFRISYVVKSPESELLLEKMVKDFFSGYSFTPLSIEQATGVSIEGITKIFLEGKVSSCFWINSSTGSDE
jgi:hypothetical protein